MRFIKMLPVVLAFACAGEDGLTITGEYEDGFGGTHTITDASWVQDYGDYGITSFEVVDYDNDVGFVIGLGGEDNAYNAGLYSRFDFVTVDDQLWFCQSVFDAGTAQEAIDASGGDAADPAAGGCGGYPWSALDPL